jgi:flagellar biosynthesis protein FlhG
MTDQANKLRELAGSAVGSPGVEAARVPMVVVTGARAGVGATTVAVNLAAVLSDRGERVLIVDAAQHRNELAEALGIERDWEHSMADVMAGTCRIAESIVRGPMGVQLLAPRSRVNSRRESEFRRNWPTWGDFSRRAQQRLLCELESLGDEIDCIVVDAGNGLTAWTRRFWLRASLVALVTTTDGKAVLDAYSAIKQCARDRVHPAVRLLVNQADNEAEADDVESRMESACKRFLSLSIEALPALPRCGYDAAAVVESAPRVWEAPNSAFGHAALWLGRAVHDLVESSTARGCVAAY